jgi:hypothetical protein
MKSLAQTNDLDGPEALERDSVEVDDYNLLTDGSTVWLSQQAHNQLAQQEMAIPKPIFDKLISQYHAPQREVTTR